MIRANLHSNVTADFLNGTGVVTGTGRSEWTATSAALVCTLANHVHSAQDLSP